MTVSVTVLSKQWVAATTMCNVAWPRSLLGGWVNLLKQHWVGLELSICRHVYMNCIMYICIYIDDHICMYNVYIPVEGQSVNLKKQTLSAKSITTVLPPGWWPCHQETQRQSSRLGDGIQEIKGFHLHPSRNKNGGTMPWMGHAKLHIIIITIITIKKKIHINHSFDQYFTDQKVLWI
jgi:hypothetical protein